jgi:sugar (pentulose or hexulose) kinase
LIGQSLGAHISGLTIGHDKYDLALALMEGAAFETALVIEEYKKSGFEEAYIAVIDTHTGNPVCIDEIR